MKDQLGRNLQYNGMPGRIVSIVPSQTELLYDLGLDAEVVGITKFCVHPDVWFRQKRRIGGTKNVDTGLILSLKPDIIFANKEENTKQDIEILQASCNVWVSDIHNFRDALRMIGDIGTITGRIEKSKQIVQQLEVDKEHFLSRDRLQKSALYLIWKGPYMSAGRDTFIHDMMQTAGFNNVETRSRYPVIQEDEIRALSPELVLLSSEPFPFRQKHMDELQILLPHATIILVDGELFSWYGSRLLRSFDYFSALHEQIL